MELIHAAAANDDDDDSRGSGGARLATMPRRYASVLGVVPSRRMMSVGGEFVDGHLCTGVVFQARAPIGYNTPSIIVSQICESPPPYCHRNMAHS